MSVSEIFLLLFQFLFKSLLSELIRSLLQFLNNDSFGQSVLVRLHEIDFGSEYRRSTEWDRISFSNSRITFRNEN